MSKPFQHPTTAEELYEVLKNIKVTGNVCVFSKKKCEELIPAINRINRLKKEKNAVILAHSYVAPEIVYGVADHVGDSYALSLDAIRADAKVVVFAAVRFMGDTAQILNPDKTVFVPGLNDGCTLADSIDGKTVRKLKQQFPDCTFVCYINTSAEVKAECDVCVTSSNVYDIVQKIPNEKIYFLPDKFMGQNLVDEMARRGVKKDVKFYDGVCYVHEEYNVDDIMRIRLEYPNAKIVSHPECNADVVKNSDYVGSTAQMLDFMMKTDAREFLMLTECGLSSRLQVEFPDKKLVGSCTMCRYMKSNRLEDIERVLTQPTERDYVRIDPAIVAKAKKCIEAMFYYTQKKG